MTPERQQPPPANIAAQAVLQYALLGDGPDVAELREMFENLVAKSMDRDTAPNAHPAFVSMISQLTPDKARLLKSIDENKDLREEMSRRRALSANLRANVPHQHRHISNLERPGVLRTEPLDRFTGLTSSCRR